MPKVTLFKNGKSPGSFQIREASDILDEIKNGTYKEIIDRLNSFEYNSKEQDDYKRTELPAIGFNGIFRYRENKGLITHSGLCAIDFDKMPEDDLKKYTKILQEDKHTYALFVSPRRNGLKAIIRIPASIELHRPIINGLRLYYNSKYYDHFEDEARLCYVSYDPELYFNPDAVEFTKAYYEDEKITLPNTEINTEVSATINKLISWEKNRGFQYTDGQKHKFLISIFGGCCRYGVKKDDAINYLYDKLNKSNGTENVSIDDYKSIAKSSYKKYEAKFNTEAFTDAPKSELPAIEEEDNPLKPSFPIEVFPEEVANMIRQFNHSLNYSCDFMSIAVMSAFSSLNGNRYKLRVKNEWIAPTIFWFAAVGEPGVNKTHPINSVLKPIKKIDSSNKELYDEAVKRLTEDEKKDHEKKPRFKQMIVNDYTLEALHSIHDINKRGLLLYRDELIGFLKDMNKYRKGSDEQFWLESFNNNSYIVNRVTKDPMMIESTNINIIGTIQPEQLSGIIKEHSGNGLTDRFLYTTNETEIFGLNNSDVSKEWVDWWDNVIRGFNQWNEYYSKDDSKMVIITPEGMDELIRIDNLICDQQKNDALVYYMKNYLSKMRTYLPRFSLLLCLIDVYLNGSTFIVDTKHIENAYKVIQYFVQSAKFVFNDADKSEEIEQASVKMNGKSKAERIEALAKMSYKQADIARKLKVSKAYVSKILKSG